MVIIDNGSDDGNKDGRNGVLLVLINFIVVVCEGESASMIDDSQPVDYQYDSLLLRNEKQFYDNLLVSIYTLCLFICVFISPLV